MTVIQFEPRKPKGGEQLLFSVFIYKDDTDQTHTVIEQPGNGEEGIDLGQFSDEMRQLDWFVARDIFATTEDPDDDLLTDIRLYRGGLVNAGWDHSDPPFVTRKQLAWMRARLADAYWQHAPRKGPRWWWHKLRRRLTGKYVPEEETSE